MADPAEDTTNDELDRGDDFEPTPEPESEPEPKSKAPDKGGEKAAEDPKADGKGEPDGDGDDGDDGGDEPPKRETLRIPKHRYDSAQAARRAAEAEVERLKRELESRQQDAAAPATSQDDLDTKLSDLDDQIDKAILDGDTAKVRELRMQSRKLEREFVKNISSQSASSAQHEAVARIKLDQTIAMLESEYPILDQNSDEYDADVVREVLDLQEAYVSTGKYTGSDALIRAVGYVVKDVTPDRGDETETKGGKRRTPVRENAETANSQPPAMGEVGADSNKSGRKTDLPDIRKLSEEEFDALPEATKKRMRGDLV